MTLPQFLEKCRAAGLRVTIHPEQRQPDQYVELIFQKGHGPVYGFIFNCRKHTVNDVGDNAFDYTIDKAIESAKLAHDVIQGPPSNLIG